MKQHRSTPMLLLAALLWLLALPYATAQELECRVEVNANNIQGTNTEVFETLKQSITEYMNDRKWSDLQVSTTERIECSIVLTLKESPSQDNYKGELQVQVRRPVYNATYNTTLFNFRDKDLEFTYQAYDPLTFTENSFENNLTAILNFYAYIMLGIDADSFAPEGGTPFYQRAFNVVNLAQSTAETGWKAFDDTRNRYALVTALTDTRTQMFRTLWYSYHREGLDAMALSVDKGRDKITKGMATLTELKKVDPTTVLLPIFSDCKLDELGNIYSKAPAAEKQEVYDLLIDIYPTENNRLEKIVEEQR